MIKQKGESKLAITLLIAIIILLLVIAAIYFIQLSTPAVVKENPGQNATSTATTTQNTLLYAENCGFTITSPAINTTVHFPVTVQGVADLSNYNQIKCAWTRFEGQAGSVELFALINNTWTNVGNWKDRSKAKALLLTDDWMSTTTHFSVNLLLDEKYVSLPAGTKMKALFTEESVRDDVLPKTLELPLVYAGSYSETMKVKVFLNEMNSVEDCGATYPVIRTVQKTPGIADASLKALFAEDNTALQPLYNGIKLQGTTAIVDFKKEALSYLNSPACMQAAVKSPIEKTLLQYPTIKKVEYSIEGKIKTDWDA